jgi:methionine-gamma-lyase
MLVEAVDLRGGHAAAARLMAKVRVMTPAVSLGSIDTLIQHPAGLAHRMVDPAAKAANGITDGLLRLSVGIEDADDLWTDLVQTLAD